MIPIIVVKYYETYSEDGYENRRFIGYKDFVQWFIKNRKNISIMDIKEIN